MSRNYDNWERLVAAVLRRDELWQLFHDQSRSPSICSSISSDFSSSFDFRNSEEVSDDATSHIVEKRYKPGVHITLVARPDGTKFVKRVRFSRMGLEEQQTLLWWAKNQEKVCKRYNALGGYPRIRQPSLVIFSSTPLENYYQSSDDEGSQTAEKCPQQEEEISRASDVTEYERIFLQELKHLVQEAIDNHEFGTEQVFIWGVKLLEDEKTDVVLLKFLRARDFHVEDAFDMMKTTILWRKEFGIDELVDQDFFDSDLERVVFMYGHTKEGHPVCYNVYGEFQNEQLYQKIFSNQENRQKFLRWRIQFLEKSIRKLDFSPGGVSTIFQVNDLKYFPGPGKLELREDTNKALKLLQDNYPEFVSKQPLLTQRTKSKFAFARPSVSMVTLYKYISAEQIPIQYGGLREEGDIGRAADGVTEIVMKHLGKQTTEFHVAKGNVVSWEVSVVGWEVSYRVEFIPTSGDEYTVIIDAMRRIGSTDEDQVISNSFTAYYPGKVVVTISNLSHRNTKNLV